MNVNLQKTGAHTQIVLVNFGNWQDTLECLNSLENLCSDFSLVLSEVCNINDSRSHLYPIVEQKFPHAKIIELSENRGFAHANNAAIKYIIAQTDSPYIWLLNNDTLPEPDSLSELVNFYENKRRDEKVGFLGSRILYADRPDIIQTLGGRFNPKTGYSVLLGKGEKDREFSELAFETDYVIGASMFFHKSLIEEIGRMPEDYFLYYEDIDWCLTAKEAGYKNYTCLASRILHKQGGSTGNKYGKSKSKNLSTRKYMYSSYLKLYKKKYPERINRARLILLKQFFGRLRRFNWKEALIILKVLLNR